MLNVGLILLFLLVCDFFTHLVVVAQPEQSEQQQPWSEGLFDPFDPSLRVIRKQEDDVTPRRETTKHHREGSLRGYFDWDDPLKNADEAKTNTEEEDDRTDDNIIDDDFDIPPCQPLGQDLLIQPRDDDDEMDDLVTYLQVSMSPDGLILASGYRVQDFMGHAKAFVMQAYTYVDKLKNWIPFLHPLRVDFGDNDEYGFAHLQMGSRYVGIGYYALRSNSEDAVDLTVTGTIQLWFMCEESGMGKHRVFWCPLVPLKRTNRDPARGTIDDNNNNNVSLFGVSFDFSESPSRLRAVAGSPLLNSGPLGTTGASNSSSLVGFVQVYEYAPDFSHHGFSFKWVSLGEPIVGTHGSFGERVKINDQGNIVAVLSTYIDRSDDRTKVSYRCLVNVYSWEETTHQWKQRGKEISSASFTRKSLSSRTTAVSDDSLICTSWAVSEDGSTLVVGPYWNDKDHNQAHGHVRAFEYHSQKDDWIQKGSDLETRIDSVRDRVPTHGDFGTPLEISHNGNRVILTSHDTLMPYHLDIRKTYLFDWDPSVEDWVPQHDYYLLATHGYLSTASLSGDGMTLAIAETTDTGGLGVIRAYDCTPYDYRASKIHRPRGSDDRNWATRDWSHSRHP